ncbi:mechanosensitive ion channel family protein [Celerinatantimonas sp. YJH-8]|uniref:mechanosensitive ion channel family protein n=1 Tax=Celerinatantimonas sp. YJH-8 TaxID=3228714 RepID=UPI0038C7CC1D
MQSWQKFGLFGLFCLMLSIPVRAEVQPSQFASLSEHIRSEQKALNELEQSWEKTKSTMTRGMLLQQIFSTVDYMGQKIEAFVESDEGKSHPEQSQQLLRQNLLILDQQEKRSTALIIDLFHSFEVVSSASQPLTWVTISVGIDYQTSLYLQKNRVLHLIQGDDAAVLKKRYRYRLEQYAIELASFLQASLRQSEQLKEELGGLSKSMQSEVESRFVLQQRISHTFSKNIKRLIPLLKEQNVDTSHYTQLTFEATGELSDLVVNSDSVWSFLRSVFSNSDQWLIQNLRILLPRALVFILLMVFFYGLSRMMKSLVSKMVRSKHSRMSTLVQEFFIATSGKAVMLMGILLACAQLGLDLGPVLAGLGVAGIVIGFALQDTLSNFASGMMILIYRPFDVGDYVEAGGVSGKVSYMSLVNTTIRTFDNQKIMVPNNKIWGSTINNITAERVRRVDMEFSISYSDDIARAEQILKDIVNQHPDVLREPEPLIKLMRLGESSLDFVVRPWARTEAYWDVYWDITRQVKLRFDQEGLSIPFPQRDIHLYQQPSSLD